jgi:hypothetical protein
MMSGMFGIDRYCAPSGLGMWGDVNPGRCPGLSHFAQLGRENCSELEEDSVIRNFRITAGEGKGVWHE